MPRITISYRREDSLDITGRIFDRLAAHFGRDAVFRDIDNIPPGADFRKHIDIVLEESDIILAIVGPRWIGPRAGQSRLASAADPVRLEIETALRKEKPLVPVLVSRAPMPRPEQLPESLVDFAYRNAVQVDAGQDFDVHIARLIRAMDRMLGDREDETVAPPEEAETILDQDVLPEEEPALAASVELDQLSEANRALEARIAELTSGREEEEQQAGNLRDEIAALREAATARTAREEEALASSRAALAEQGAEIAKLRQVNTGLRVATRPSVYRAGLLVVSGVLLVAATYFATRHSTPPDPAIALDPQIKARDVQIADLDRRLREALSRASAPSTPPPTTAPLTTDPIGTAAIVSLAKKYEMGLGVARNYSEAARLYRQAADRGDGTALLNLGLLYREGLGVTRDSVEACRLFRQALAAGNNEAPYLVSNCR
jgi:hypothetical protein